MYLQTKDVEGEQEYSNIFQVDIQKKVETQRTETRWETLTHTGKNMTRIYCVVVMRDERAKGKEERERDPSAALYRDAR